MSNQLHDSAHHRIQRARSAAEHGLYRPEQERDACGMGFVVDTRGRVAHDVVARALTVLERLEHRGGAGCDPETGDGAGILLQIPDAFFRSQLRERAIELPEAGGYAVGMLFMPTDPAALTRCERALEAVIEEEGMRVLAWRDVPVVAAACGPMAREVMPTVRQLFVEMREAGADAGAFARGLYVLRRRASRLASSLELEDNQSFYVCSFSERTIVYKGLLLARQIPRFYPDLADARVASAIALVHSRFSTNTFPSWPRAHPYRYVVHNGEFNTIRGNVNWMRAREKSFESDAFGGDIDRITPVIDPQGSDSGMFDEALDLLLQTGRSLPHAVRMLIPAAWQGNKELDGERRAFYQYHACLMEAWDGPASVAFTDGRFVGAVLDRNGLRPSRFVQTRDGLIVMASEVGCIDLDPEEVVQKGRLEPGRMLLIDSQGGGIVDDRSWQAELLARQPYVRWVEQGVHKLSDLPRLATDFELPQVPEHQLVAYERVHGYTREDIRILLRPMAISGKENIGSMGNDTPLAVLSARSQSLFNYFKQLFAQVTNPPIDPLRENLIMSLQSTLGPERNLFTESEEHCKMLVLDQPILRNADLARIRNSDLPELNCATIDARFRVTGHAGELEGALGRLCERVEAAIDEGHTIIILSDRKADHRRAPIPSLLATAAVHHHLIRAGKRTRCSLIVESAEPREIMHHCLLMGYGAAAINPYLVFEIFGEQVKEGLFGAVQADQAELNYIKAISKGLEKVMSKMGISTLQSYRGAQVFEAIGINRSVIDRYFTWTSSRIGGIGLDEIAREVVLRHRAAYDLPESIEVERDVGGVYQWRRRGEYHMYNPETIAALQHAVRSGKYELFSRFSSKASGKDRQLCTIRGLLEIQYDTSVAIDIDEVEPVAEIVKRFKTGAMSFGSISKEAHENLAIAMNRIGGKSNTGEGGEDPARFVPDADGTSRRSAIKQVASGRFGVTMNYLVNASEIQIKMAQGAKPGEGGQLPGHKVDEEIARVRCSTAGVGLISPPPHHDIYSIEDLAQLIYDLKNANDAADISVKLVSEVGVGTIAAGVAKAKADCILIAGDSGGTGASSLTSIKHAGAPWELGLAETHQTLVANDLRSRIRLEVDGQLKTGRDVAIACLLGAEEFGFGTAALVASGCIMMRVCHLNTCPVGVATQDPELRKRFAGQPDHVINFMYFVARELREIMAKLGFRRIEDMVGRVDLLESKAALEHFKASGLDLSPLLHRVEAAAGSTVCNSRKQNHGLERVLDRSLIHAARPALERKTPVRIEQAIGNGDRTACTLLSSAVVRRYGSAGLPPGTIDLRFSGSAGQSFAAFCAPGLDIVIRGDANDYCCKGMSGGRVAIAPPEGSRFVAEDNVICGNVALYGATAGRLFVRGRAGERFAVRNSGATAVVEGVGDHGCEYMTRGVVVVIGSIGRNFGAGMSGGVAYVWDCDQRLEQRYNAGMVDLEGLDAEDEQQILALLEEHRERTGSNVARRLLRDWSRERKAFVKVMPREYKRVLAERARKAAEPVEKPRVELPVV